MNIVNKVECKLENFEKCHLIADSDCPVGQIYDYACALLSFSIQKMQEAQPKPREESSSVEVAEEPKDNSCQLQE